MLHKHSVTYLKVQMGIIPIVVLRIAGGRGVNSLLCHPLNFLHTVELVTDLFSPVGVLSPHLSGSTADRLGSPRC